AAHEIRYRDAVLELPLQVEGGPRAEAGHGRAAAPQRVHRLFAFDGRLHQRSTWSGFSFFSVPNSSIDTACRSPSGVHGLSRNASSAHSEPFSLNRTSRNPVRYSTLMARYRSRT